MDSAYTEDQILTLAAGVDSRSNHPLAKAVLTKATERKLSIPEPEQFEVIRGRGVTGTIDGKKIFLGNKAFLQEK